MAKRPLTKDTFATLARASGLELSDPALDELLPQLQQTLEAAEGLDALDLDSVEPAVIFRPEEE